MLAFSCWLLSCGPVKTLSVLPPQGGTHDATTRAPDRFRIKVDASSVQLPLVVNGAHTRYVDLDRAIETSLEQALAAGGTEVRAQDYLLYAELIEARAEYADGRLLVQLSVRATLKQNHDTIYVAQTHAHACQAGALGADDGLSVVLGAVGTVVTQLRGWFLDLAAAQ